MTSTVRELRDLDEADLLERLESSKEELFNLRFQLATGQLDNPTRIGQVRREVARILTILRERELEVLDELAAPDRPREPAPAAPRGRREEAEAPGEAASAAVRQGPDEDAGPDADAGPDEEAPAPKRRRLRRSREAT